MTRIILVRHGETDWNRAGRFRGRIDVPLTDRGQAQAEACARHVAARWAPTALYSSPLTRAVETAAAIGRAAGLEVRRLEALTDLDHGEWHGLTLAEARERSPRLAAAWLKAPSTVRFPGGETLAELQSRALAGLRQLVQEHPDATLAAVAHDAVNRVLLLGALDASLDAFFRVGQETTAVNVLEADGGGLRVVTLNDVSHLTGP